MTITTSPTFIAEVRAAVREADWHDVNRAIALCYEGVDYRSDTSDWESFGWVQPAWPIVDRFGRYTGKYINESGGGEYALLDDMRAAILLEDAEALGLDLADDEGHIDLCPSSALLRD